MIIYSIIHNFRLVFFPAWVCWYTLLFLSSIWHVFLCFVLLWQLSQLPYPGGGKSLPDAPAPPNNILFIQNLPHETTPMMLQMLFCQYPGFKEVRMIEAKPGIAFVEYGDEMQATISMQSLQSFKITPSNPMVITYAKK